MKRPPFTPLQSVALLLAAIAAAALLLLPLFAMAYRADPQNMRLPFLPPCLLHLLTGLYCMGCGATRSVHYLLHGDLYAALRMNAIVLPLLALVGVQLWCMAWARLRQTPTRYLPTWVWWGVLGVMVVYTVLRNLPFAPFCYLAPTYL